MSEQFDPAAAYGQALALNEAAATAGQFEATYHFLAAALHCAQAVGETERLYDVAALARAQQHAVDTAAPTHRLATRRGRGIYAMAAVQAEAVAKRLESAEQITKRRRRLGSWPGAGGRTTPAARALTRRSTR
jgi:hypothetical protein